jgi:hypothetical protein
MNWDSGHRKSFDVNGEEFAYLTSYSLRLILERASIHLSFEIRPLPACEAAPVAARQQ